MRCAFFKILILYSVLLCGIAQADGKLSVYITGILDKQALLNTQARLNRNIQSLPTPLSTEQVENFYLYSDDDIIAGVAPFGYFTPDVHKQLIQKKPMNWQINYAVQLNNAARITSLDLHVYGEGENEPALQQLLAVAPLKIGEPFISSVYDEYKNKLLTAAQELGFIHAHFIQHEALVDRAQGTVVIHLNLATEQKYYFGAVHFAKNPLSDDFLKRYVSFKTGQAFSTTKSTELETDLKNSTYFSNVQVQPDLTHPDENHQIPINVQLIPVPRHQYIFGLGYGTDTGPRATLGSNWHYLNAYGHRLDALLQLSRVQSTASAKYIIPGNNPLTDQYNINASLQNNKISQGDSTVKQLGAGYTYSHNRWQYTVSLSEQIERYSFFNDPYQTSHLLLPGVSVQNVMRNDPLFPTEGHRFNVKLLAAKQGIAADTSLVQTELSEKWIHSFNDKNMILLRSDFGITSIHDTNLLPLSLNFFAGGAQSVRGYGYNNIGPGRYLLVGSAEYRYRVYGKWYAATFFDLGNAFNNWPQAPHAGFRSSIGAVYRSLNQGAGIGVVWNSPLGAMELTYAQEVNVSGRPSRVQFNMGTDL